MNGQMYRPTCHVALCTGTNSSSYLTPPQHVVSKVLSTLHTLEAGTWIKIIYMEKGKQVAKVYTEDRSIIVDGSHAQYDGER